MAHSKARSAEARETKSRSAEARAVPKTIHTSRFYVPPSVWPKGMTYAWVAVAHDSSGTPNADNWRNKYRNGWRPVPRTRHPDLFPMVPNVGFGDDTDDLIREGGQILCEKATAEVEADKAANEQRSIAQMQAIDWTQDVNANPFAKTMPRVDKGSKTEFGHAAAFKQD